MIPLRNILSLDHVGSAYACDLRCPLHDARGLLGAARGSGPDIGTHAGAHTVHLDDASDRITQGDSLGIPLRRDRRVGHGRRRRVRAAQRFMARAPRRALARE